MYRLALLVFADASHTKTQAVRKGVKLEPTTPSKPAWTKFGMDVSMLSPETRQMTLTLQDTPASRDLVAELCQLSSAAAEHPGPPYIRPPCTL